MNRSKAKKKPEDLLGNTAFLLTDVARLYRTTFDERMKAFGLDRSAWWLISFLCYYDGATQQELAEVMDLTRGGMGKLIDRMERDGFVKRRMSGEDRRTKRIFLTPQTKRLAAEVDAQSEAVVARSLSPLTKDEVSTLNSLLLRIRAGGFVQMSQVCSSVPKRTRRKPRAV